MDSSTCSFWGKVLALFTVGLQAGFARRSQAETYHCSIYQQPLHPVPRLVPGPSHLVACNS